VNARVSAVVVTYRSEARLPALLPPLREAVDEVVVVDNASDDDSVAVAWRLVPDAIVIRRDRNDGFAAGVNAGAAASTGDLVLLVNPDVVLTPPAVDALVAAAARHPGDIVGPIVRYPDGRLQPSRHGLPTVWNLLGEQALVPESTPVGRWPARLWPRWRSYDREEHGPILSGCSLLVPRATLQSVGPFDEGYFLYWEEVDWQLRARLAGHRSWLVPAAEVTHDRGRSAGPSDPRLVEVFHRSTRRFLRRWLPVPARSAVLAILGGGQLARLVAWSLPPFSDREGARLRRDQHRRALRVLWALPRRPAGRL